jgi:hypothetical protein
VKEIEVVLESLPCTHKAITAAEAVVRHYCRVVLDLSDFCETDHTVPARPGLQFICSKLVSIFPGEGRHGKPVGLSE